MTRIASGLVGPIALAACLGLAAAPWPTRTAPVLVRVPAEVPDQPHDPPPDPWTPAPPSAPARPHTTSVVTVPAAWQRLDDISAAWEDLLARVPDGSEIVFPAGTYRTRDSLVVLDRHDLSIRGPAAGPPARLTQVGTGTELRFAAQRSVVVISQSRRMAVSNLTIVGANPRGASTDLQRNPLEGQHGINVTFSSRDVTVSDNDISDTFGDGVSAQGWSSRVRITGNRVRNVGRQGITSLDASDVIIEDNRVDDVAGSAVDVEPNFAGARVAVLSNEAGGRGSSLNLNGPVLHDVLLEGNRIDGPLVVRIWAKPMAGPTFSRFARIAVRDNTGSGTGSLPAVTAQAVDFLTVEDNVSGGPASLRADDTCPFRSSGNRSADDRAWSSPWPRDPTGGLVTPMTRRLGRAPTVAEVSTAAGALCSHRADLAAVLASLPAGADLQRRADRAASAAWWTGTTELEDSTGVVGRAAAPPSLPVLDSLRDAARAGIVMTGRVPDSALLAELAYVLRSRPGTEADDLRQAARTLGGRASVRTCSDGPRLVVRAGWLGLPTPLATTAACAGGGGG